MKKMRGFYNGKVEGVKMERIIEIISMIYLELK